MAESTRRKLICTGSRVISTKKLPNGGEQTLYEVFATDEDGTVIEEPLRAFTELEEGIAIEYDVSSYHHERFGTSYTLTPPPRQSAKRLRRLEAWAISQGFDPEKDYEVSDSGNNETLAQKAKKAGEEDTATPAPQNDELDDKFGKEDDIPF
jgi:hypothetical protein